MRNLLHNRPVSRAIPGLLAIALLALALAAGEPDPTGPAPPPQLQPRCTEFASAVAGDSTIGIPVGTGIEQALPPMMSVAACSLRAYAPINTFLKLTLRDWDPTTLAPDPDAIALRRTFFDGSSLYYTGGKLPRVSFVPPVVLSSVPDVAEPPKPQVAMQLTTTGSYYGTPIGYFTPEGPAELPAAAKVNADGSREPLPGPHPVLAHAVCSGGDDLASLRVVQAVSRTDVKPFPSPREFAQRFRVPQQVEVRWIELAMAGFISFGGTYNDPGVHQSPILAIVDGEALPQPAPDMPPPLVEAPVDLGALFSSSFNGPVWGSHLDFDRTVTLEPDHDYWIYVREAATSTFLNRRIHGDEPPEFTAGIGPYFCRADSAGAWNQTADQVLAFRIVAHPTAPPPPPAPPPIARPASPPTPPLPTDAAFALNTTPNPAPGAVRVAWSGAVGPVRCEVLDARGRRLAEGWGGAAGAWTWQGTDRDGRAVASGVYFVRARDSAGRASNQRVMIVR
jgi:hypothetical protein